jgi:preprotein translocase subunit SecE
MWRRYDRENLLCNRNQRPVLTQCCSSVAAVFYVQLLSSYCLLRTKRGMAFFISDRICNFSERICNFSERICKYLKKIVFEKTCVIIIIIIIIIIMIIIIIIIILLYHVIPAAVFYVQLLSSYCLLRTKRGMAFFISDTHTTRP